MNIRYVRQLFLNRSQKVCCSMASSFYCIRAHQIFISFNAFFPMIFKVDVNFLKHSITLKSCFADVWVKEGETKKMSGLTHVAFIIGLLSKLVHCQIGTSYQQNHPNHVLSNMMQNTDPIMAPSIATPQTGKTPINLIYRVCGNRHQGHVWWTKLFWFPLGASDFLLSFVTGWQRTICTYFITIYFLSVSAIPLF